MATRLRVLYVDDDEVDQLALKRLVRRRKLGYQLVTAGSKAAALAALTSGPAFDVAILDYNLPDGTGLEILPHLGPTLGIIITGWGSEEVASRALELGAWAYVVKHQGREHLDRLPLTIRQVLERRRMQVELLTAQTRIAILQQALPSCWNCHRVQYEGKWADLAAVVQEAAAIELCGSLCPECRKLIAGRRPPAPATTGKTGATTIKVREAYAINYPGQDPVGRMERDSFPPEAGDQRGERLSILRLRPENLFAVRAGSRWEDLYLAAGVGVGMVRATSQQLDAFSAFAQRDEDRYALRVVQKCRRNGPAYCARQLYPPVDWPIGREFVGVD